AKKLRPRFLVMIIPSRWFGGGKGLNDFRREMLNDNHIRKIVDFEDASEVFPGVDIAGGICYFLWERDSTGPCEAVNMHNGTEAVSTRSLNEFKTFIRHGQAVPIIRKVLAKKEKSMSEQVSSRKPFGLPTNARPSKSGDIKLRWNNGEGPYNSTNITTGVEMIDQWKVITSYVGYDHAGNPGKDGRRRVLSKIDILPPGTICTETYLVIGSYEIKTEAINLMTYMKTRFFRFLVAQFMYSHHITKDSYFFVPALDMKIQWTGQKLYKKYGLTKDEIAFIESKIRPMEPNGE
ncbi:MAG: Eco57I restriction-modification methylase domain-containing protein, partial [Nitrospiria bacterium]